MDNFRMTLDRVEALIKKGDFEAADEILRPHCRFPSPKWNSEIIDLETQIVDGLMAR